MPSSVWEWKMRAWSFLKNLGGKGANCSEEAKCVVKLLKIDKNNHWNWSIEGCFANTEEQTQSDSNFPQLCCTRSSLCPHYRAPKQ